MILSLSSGVTGLQEMQQRMNVIGNNIANVNTTGYKSSRSVFADALSQNINGSQVGTGVSSSSIQGQFNQGAVTSTASPTDLAIAGEGFFVVRNPVNGSEYVTRAGEFHLDREGYLVNDGGLRVQGFSDAGLGTRGDIRIDATGAPSTANPTAKVSGFFFDDTGKVNVKLSDGTEFVRGQVLLQNFRNPQALVREGGNLFTGMASAGALSQTEPAQTQGMGRIAGGALELSNVNMTGEFSSMITTQRAFQANARVITTSDEMLQDIVNLKR